MKNHHEIIIKIELKEKNKVESNNTWSEADGSYHQIINGDDVMDIDKCEKALLDLQYEAVRQFLSNHFTQISYAKAMEHRMMEKRLSITALFI